MLISIAWIQIEKKKTLNINLAKYKYERELENSPCISSDGNAILKMVVVYDKPRGGEGYVLGFAHFEMNENEAVASSVSIRNIQLNVAALLS